MQDIYFDHNGRRYSGYMLLDQDPTQNYLWFVFNDESMITSFGDSIAFRVRNRNVEPVYLYTKHADFVELIRQKIEAALQAGNKLYGNDLLQE